MSQAARARPTCQQETDAATGIPSRTLSVSNWRITRAGLAPRAARIANSRARPVERASSRLGDVGARDQQHKTDRAEQHQQNSFHIADDVDLERDQ